ncbi:sensor histidine kinase [Streptomyces sp. NPDC048604]|uniref:sensor histidine kinase n=1 Tax=Streptomyces sp. NPDC048604 TaxID=3365578 RepID=UPI0037102485
MEDMETTTGAADQDWSAGAPPLSRFIERKAQRVRDLDRRRPLIWDALVTAFWTTAALTDAAGGWRNTARNPDVPVWLVVTTSVALSLPLLWRRRRPMAVLAMMAAAALVGYGSGAFLQAAYLQMIVVYNLALRSPLRSLVWPLLLALPPLVAGSVRYPKGSWDQLVVPVMWAYALVALLGVAVRSRRDYTAALVERARRLEIERDQQARLAAAAERNRIAREMHDIIGHNLSVITGLADGGAYAAAKSPERAAEALTAIGTTSRQALGELRRLLGVLRDEDAEATADRTPQPTLSDLEALLEGVEAAGLPVTLTVHHAPTPLPLSAGRQLTVYRVIQEALTNTLKHAHGEERRAEVLLAYSASDLQATITDTGAAVHGAPRQGDGQDGGQGLNGMRERTALYDGTLDAGPLPEGGWQVRLTLALEDSPS